MSGGNDKASKRRAEGEPPDRETLKKTKTRAAKRGDAAGRPVPPGGGTCPIVGTLPVGRMDHAILPERGES